MVNPRKCPACEQNTMLKVIYAGLPMRFCRNQRCFAVFGFCSLILFVIPFDGTFFVYKNGYLRAFWKWLFWKDE